MLKLEKKELYTLFGVSHKTYNEVINDKRILPATWVEIMFTKFSVHPHWIITGENPMFLLPKKAS